MAYPALYLYPVDDTWDPKQVVLTRQRTRIGRKISEKTEPDPRNGYFDSMALSRQHAEVWVEDGGVSPLERPILDGVPIPLS